MFPLLHVALLTTLELVFSNIHPIKMFYWQKTNKFKIAEFIRNHHNATYEFKNYQLNLIY